MLIERVSSQTQIALRPVRILHQFPRSHFCEKVRWHMDAKGLAYEVRNLFPGAHARINRRLGGQASVPLLIDGPRVVHNSGTIALYLEETYPQRRLLPEDEGLRALVLALQTYLDSAVGPAVRHWVYGHLLRKRGLTTKLFFRGYSRKARWTGRLLSPVFERRLGRLYPGDDATLATMETAVLDGMERLENTLEHDPGRYLVGNVLTLADITAASLLAPVVGPPGSPWGESDPLPPAVQTMRDRLRERVGGRWVLQRYAQDRTLPQPVLSAPPSPVSAEVAVMEPGPAGPPRLSQS